MQKTLEKNTAVLHQPNTLEVTETPLTGTILIEASAGTGKTYTIASLYIRLLLNLGKNRFPKALGVEDILVVTYTEAATQELKSRIRERIHQSKIQLEAYQQKKNQAEILKEEEKKAIFSDNSLLMDLVDEIDDLDLAIQRLRLAEQNMDLAAIFTIHGFCRRALVQYTPYSDLELTTDETTLIQQFTNEFWREYFYPVSYLSANFIHHYLLSPSHILFKKNIKSHLSGELKVKINEPHLLHLSLPEFLQQYVEKGIAQVQALKQAWLESAVEIGEIFKAEYSKKKSGDKRVKGNPYGEKNVTNWLAQMKVWAEDNNDFTLPDCSERFSQQNLIEKYTPEGKEPLIHFVFEQIDQVKNIPWALYENVLLYHCIQVVSKKLLAYKLTHKEKNFDDLLRFLRDALYQSQGGDIAQRLRQQYPFAMIDEFQDTDKCQYQIFEKIYVGQADCGFMMIGDPKQAIYKFRGADIFTYLNASEQATHRFTLDKNYRSTSELISAVNGIFNFNNPFLYEKIQFSPVSAGKKQAEFYFQGEKQAPLVFHLGGELNKKGNIKKQTYAETCAYSIAKWLGKTDGKSDGKADGAEKSAVENQAVLKEEMETPIKDSDIAVLVENYGEAELIQQALRKYGIASVYLSDKSSVFDADEAQELLFILKACLNPFHTKAVLNAIACSLFALTTEDMFSIKNDDSRLEQWVNRFERYHNTWRFQGVLPMLYQLFLDKDEQERCLLDKVRASQNAERRLTDLLHLAELLQQASPLHESHASLVGWFERQIRDKQARSDEHQLRLESENDLVKIVTIHKSKGLQYGLVWLPFLLMSDLSKQDPISTYFDGKDNRWDLENAHSEQSEKERQAEKMRLLYVALTRAKYQINITLLETLPKDWTAIKHCLCGGENPETADTRNLIQQVQQRLENGCKNGGENGEERKELIAIETIDESQYSLIEKATSSAEPQKLNPAIFTGNIERDWRLSSFTDLERIHRHNFLKQENPEKSTAVVKTVENVENVETSCSLCDSWKGYESGFTPTDFPRGKRAGDLLHSFFERNYFHLPLNEERICHLYKQLKLTEEWQAPLTQWLTHILQTPLVDDFCLKNLKPEDCVKEMKFFFNLHRTFDVDAFNQVWQKYYPSARPWLFEQMQGMLQGYVDLVFRHQGKYYILDYKSNFLGEHLEDYHSSKLTSVMVAEHYDLQAVIYTLAVNRYLKQRLPNYDYKQHFGGVIYTFLRGMNGESAEYGIFADCPSLAFIDELEGLF